MTNSQPSRFNLVGIALVTLAWIGAASQLRAQGDDDRAVDAPQPNDAAARTMRSRADDETVRELLQTNPTSPAELVRVADLLIDLSAMVQAAPLTARLAQAQLDEAGLASLAEQFGSATFLKFALVEELQPDGRKFADAVLSAADKKVRDPARIAALIEQLKNPSIELRHAAVVRLRAGRESSLVALLAALSADATAEHHASIGAALAAFGREALPPLVAVARGAEGALQIKAIEILGRMDQSDLAVELLGPALVATSPEEVQLAAKQALQELIGRVPDIDEAADALERRARSLYDRRFDQEDGDGPLVGVWHWDAEASRLVAEPAPPRVAALDLAARWAGDAIELKRHHHAARRIFLGALLEADALYTAAAQPAPDGREAVKGRAAVDEVADRGAAVVEDLLEDSIASGHLVAAASAARILGKIGTVDLLYRKSPRPSALVEAARHADRRLRFAALEAIVALRPSKPYPGSSFVPAALGFFASSTGARRALVGHPRASEAEREAGLMAALGYETYVATFDREVLARATASPDLELALIDFKLAAPTSGQLLERIHADSRTARLPIGIVAASDELARAERLARLYPPAMVIIPTANEASLEFQLRRLLAEAGGAAVDAVERDRQAEQALGWLVELAQVSPGLYNLRRIEPAVLKALDRPEHSLKAATVLAALGTATSQKALVDLASQSLSPLEVRQAAAEAFIDSVIRYGTLLTTAELARQYERYNRSEAQERETQRLLGSVLDAIEARAEVE
jgi:CheY-like chemotaxis protein